MHRDYKVEQLKLSQIKLSLKATLKCPVLMWKLWGAIRRNLSWGWISGEIAAGRGENRWTKGIGLDSILESGDNLETLTSRSLRCVFGVFLLV